MWLCGHPGAQESFASWQFDGNFGLHEQLVKDEEALRSYQIASSKNFSQDLVLATVLAGIKESLHSQQQLKMWPSTK